MKSKSVFVCLLAAIVVFFPLFSGTAVGQEKGAMSETKAQKSRGTGPDENIKSKSDLNDPKATVEAPPEKGGKSRGLVYCDTTFQNWTPWKIQTYVNGNYVGLVSPYGNLYTPANLGNVVLYGRADFTDGSWLYWGPQTIQCSNAYTWQLYP